MDYYLYNGFLLNMIFEVLYFHMYMLLFHLFYLNFLMCMILYLYYVEVLLLFLSFLFHILKERYLCLGIRKVDFLLLLFSLGGRINFQSSVLLLIKSLILHSLLDQMLLYNICNFHLHLFVFLYSFFHLVLLRNELSVENCFSIKDKCRNLIEMYVCFEFEYLFCNKVFCFLSLFHELLLHLGIYHLFFEMK